MTPTKLPTALIPSLLKSRKQIHGNSLYLKFQAGQGRWQVIIPARLTKTKVEHNRLKRRLKAIVGCKAITNKLLDFLLVAKKNYAKTSPEALRVEVNGLLDKRITAKN